MGTGPVSEQIKLLLLDSVLHLAPGAVDLLVEFPVTVRQSRYDEPGIRSLVQVLSFRNHPSFLPPALLGLVPEPGEYPGCPAGLLVPLTGSIELAANDLFQTLVLRNTKDVVNLVVLAPAHDVVPTESAISANQYSYLRPASSQPCDNVLELFHAAFGRIDAGALQRCAKGMVVAEYVEGEIAMAVIVFVKVLSLLVAMNLIVGGIYVEDKLLRNTLLHLGDPNE